MNNYFTMIIDIYFERECEYKYAELSSVLKELYGCRDDVLSFTDQDNKKDIYDYFSDLESYIKWEFNTGIDEDRVYEERRDK